MSVDIISSVMTIAEAMRIHFEKRTGSGSGSLIDKVEHNRGLIDKVEHNVLAVDSLNYAMLHNNRSIFEAFSIKNRTAGAGNIRVIVDLFQGELSVPYKGIFPFNGVDETIDLRGNEGPSAIRLPLASRLMRSLKEPLRTTMLVQIANTGEPVKFFYEKTFSVTLLPVDQWRDTPAESQWLPSFVQQRDPAILQIIQQAQKYLMALQDDAGAGFDGYESLDSDDGDDFQALDAQVQAIWYALQYDHELHYVNPPPAYRKDSQRLRMPSEVIAGKRGTCIDLAILLASCLENIEIYPVVFLLKNHAFPAYWRSSAFHEQFLKDTVNKTRSGKMTGGWYFEKDAYHVIRQAVGEGQLVPLETVRLTDEGSFRTALDEGLENLRSPVGFDAMIDIQVARDNKVTPIPLAGDY